MEHGRSEFLCAQIKPAVGILPMGTGNDLARILQWGQGEDATVDVNIYLRRILTAKVVALDRFVPSSFDEVNYQSTYFFSSLLQMVSGYQCYISTLWSRHG